MTQEYRVQLDVFSGPLDLLLFLIRRDELDVQDIPIARITEQYLDYVRLLEQVDPNAAGDFLVMASTLVELKSRALLPTPPLEPQEDEPQDARALLVRQLLEYKRFKDAARALDELAEERRQRFVRVPADLPKELQGVELEQVEVWDLLSAFARVMTSIGQGPGLQEIRYDDTPIEEYAAVILDALTCRGPITFDALFEDRANRSELVGLFLALLELLRQQRIRAEQERVYGTIYLFLVEVVDEPAEAPSALSPPEAVGADATALPDDGAPVYASLDAAEVAPPGSDPFAAERVADQEFHDPAAGGRPERSMQEHRDEQAE